MLIYLVELALLFSFVFTQKSKLAEFHLAALSLAISGIINYFKLCLSLSLSISPLLKYPPSLSLSPSSPPPLSSHSLNVGLFSLPTPTAVARVCR